jgi:FAD/FMN-containing dehydrogenase
VTYLQVRYAPENYAEKIAAIRAAFPGEVMQHLELMREGGRVMFAGLSLVKFTTEARLDEIVRIHEQMGCMVFNPHRYTLEEGGRQAVDGRQLAFKREADPKGLLNPGKMIAWDDPQWGYDRAYAYAKLQAAE